MNYTAHYEKLIARARSRVLGGYVERHHVVPKCMGGGNEVGNIVALTAEEHFVAHLLLCKMHPTVGGLAIAAWFMATIGKHVETSTGNKRYGWLRRLMAEGIRGKKLSPETIEKIAVTKRGKKTIARNHCKNLGSQPR